MSWSATLKTVGLTALRLLARLLYVLSAPLRWVLYAVYAIFAFVFSPVRAFYGATVSAASLLVDMISRLKYLYVYLAFATFIGICAGFMLHGTQSFFIALLGLNDDTPERQKIWDDQAEQYRPLHTRPFSMDEEEEEKVYDDDQSSPDRDGRYPDTRREATRMHQDLPFEERWKLLRVAEQPKRRRKGLLGQTIHEESSESDLS